ncbi:hypothetical protein LSH36_209g04021 [Paralvinella palmiformis]|uniref:Cysteine dioxygenase n=1 Tax=Paralvinella palmiformis TaxID=53620 RepID=A0AAD9N695_9ANNE|nr:hypothetical protein LSH36_209g04021 [Paralvinella palmiformis]
MEEYTEVPVINSLEELIQKLRQIFKSDKIDVDYVTAVLSSYKSNPKDWKKYSIFDTHRYTRNLIDEGNGKYNLMALCWGESHGSSIHDHSNSHCFVKILEGQLKETRYNWPSESQGETEMNPSEISIYEKDQVAYMSDRIGLHRMENPSHVVGSVSMHLYIPPFSSCRTFDERTGHKRVAQVTFYSKYGERTPFGMNNNPISERVLHFEHCQKNDRSGGLGSAGFKRNKCGVSLLQRQLNDVDAIRS